MANRAGGRAKRRNSHRRTGAVLAARSVPALTFLPIALVVLERGVVEREESLGGLCKGVCEHGGMSNLSADAVAGMLSHMNGDHADAVIAYAQHAHRASLAAAETQRR
jgi:hypothetical protein